MRRLILSILIAMLVIGLAEAGVRSIATGLVEPLEWYTANARLKISQMDDLSDSGGASVVFVGTSMARDGIDPHLFIARSSEAKSAYNASLSNGSPRIMADWLRHEVVPRLKPDLVVWALESFTLNDSATTLDDSAATYFATPRASRDVESELETWLDERLYLFRYQQVLRDPVAVWNAIRGVEPSPEVADLPWQMTSLGRTDGRDSASIDDIDLEAQTERLSRVAFADYSVGGLEYAALEETIRWLQQEGIDVVLVTMPVSGAYKALEEDGTFPKFMDTLDALSSKYSIPSGSLAGTYEDEAFADALHMNGLGVRRFTSLLATWIDSLADAGEIGGLR